MIDPWFVQVLLLLGTTVAVVVAFQRLHIPSSLGYLLVGVLPGPATHCILEQEQEQDCDLIVIGKHGYGMVEEFMMGSVTKHVLALSGCDLLVADRTVA